MTRDEFEKKFAHVLDEHVNTDMAYALNELLNDQETAIEGMLNLLYTFPTGLSDMLSEETMAALKRLRGEDKDEDDDSL